MIINAVMPAGDWRALFKSSDRARQWLLFDELACAHVRTANIKDI
jgi:hypothetical protein